MLTQNDETTLINQAMKDKHSFAELYNYYFPRVYNYVRYRVADFHTADDLTSQIFEKLFCKLKHFNPEKATFSCWLFSIARNTITDYYRSNKHTTFSSLDATAEIADPELGLADSVVLNETKKHLLKALHVLSQNERDIIALKFWSDLTNRDIASITGSSESNIGVKLFRAMRRLRVILESQGMEIHD